MPTPPQPVNTPSPHSPPRKAAGTCGKHAVATTPPRPHLQRPARWDVDLRHTPTAFERMVGSVSE